MDNRTPAQKQTDELSKVLHEAPWQSDDYDRAVRRASIAKAGVGFLTLKQSCEIADPSQWENTINIHDPEGSILSTTVWHRDDEDAELSLAEQLLEQINEAS